MLRGLALAAAALPALAQTTATMADGGAPDSPPAAKTFTLKREIPVESQYDVLVAGGGPAGIGLSVGARGGMGNARETSLLVNATAMWQFGKTGEPRVSANGNVSLGVALDGAERQASLDRGRDGKVAEFKGGYPRSEQDQPGAFPRQEFWTLHRGALDMVLSCNNTSVSSGYRRGGPGGHDKGNGPRESQQRL